MGTSVKSEDPDLSAFQSSKCTTHKLPRQEKNVHFHDLSPSRQSQVPISASKSMEAVESHGKYFILASLRSRLRMEKRMQVRKTHTFLFSFTVTFSSMLLCHFSKFLPKKQKETSEHLNQRREVSPFQKRMNHLHQAPFFWRKQPFYPRDQKVEEQERRELFLAFIVLFILT